jgi:DNA polymerase
MTDGRRFNRIQNNEQACGTFISNPASRLGDAASGRAGAPGSSPGEECDHSIAWHRPDHRILPLAAPWYARRYAILPWTILTPDASATWNPASGHLVFTPGVPRESTPSEAEFDELEPVWRMHYAAHSLQPAALQEA